MASDLLDLASLEAFAKAASDWGGQCDVLVNNAVYQGEGAQRLFMDTSIDELSTTLRGDVVAPALLIQRAVALMTEHGGGTIVNMSSGVVFMNPSGTVSDHTGWSLAYAAGKAGIDQFGKVLNAELGEAGVRVFTVEPGFTAYGDAFHSLVRDHPDVRVCPPEAIGAAIAWLIESPEADRLLKHRVHLPGVTTKYGLLPGWEGPGTPYPTVVLA
jgi:3-oxoacyl-[acyl-carrier protein] reductase